MRFVGPTNFKYCEDFLLANETGVAYAACDPVKIDFNKIMGINRLVPGEPIPSGGIWKVNYNQVNKYHFFPASFLDLMSIFLF